MLSKDTDEYADNLVSYHEAGHTITALLFRDFFDVRKVTITANTNGAGGYTLFTPKEKVHEIWIKGKPLNEDEDYWVAAPNFVTQGGDGYWEFKNSIEYIDSGVLIVDAAENFLREKKTYEPKYEGRVKAIEQGAGDGI